jgi:hypothetical protein
MTYKKTILSLLLALITVSAANGQSITNLLKLYRGQIESQGAGIWRADNYVFFVAEQACLKPKEYSGTAESKKATTAVLQLITDDLIKILAPTIKESPLLAKRMRAVLEKNRITKVNSFFVNGNLVVDEDVGDCKRKRALAFVASEYDQVSADTNKNITENDLANAKQASIVQTVKFKDWPLLIEYAKAKRMLLPYLIWQTHAKAELLAHPKSQFIDGKQPNKFFLNESLRLFEANSNCIVCEPLLATTAMPQDVAGFIEYTASFAGIGLLPRGNEQQKNTAASLKSRANKHFEMAKFPNQIIQDLSIALYLDPGDTKALSQLGAVLRAVNKPHYALYVHSAAASIDPAEASHYIHIIKALQQMEQADAARQIYVFLKENYQAFNKDDWADSQLNALTQEFN